MPSGQDLRTRITTAKSSDNVKDLGAAATDQDHNPLIHLDGYLASNTTYAKSNHGTGIPNPSTHSITDNPQRMEFIRGAVGSSTIFSVDISKRIDINDHWKEVGARLWCIKPDCHHPIQSNPIPFSSKPINRCI